MTAIAERISAIMGQSSWIRRMFDEGAKLTKEKGSENVFDFTLGNPIAEPPHEVMAQLQQLVTDPTPGAHRYMPNAGIPEVRKKVAAHLSADSGLSFGPDTIVMTCGAGGALNVIFRTLLDPGDEVALVAPYFAEYLFYIANHQSVAKIAKSDECFQLDLKELDRAIGPKTRILLLNSPNNPTGAVYPAESLKAVGELLERKSAEAGRPIYLVMDEPYRKLTYTGYVAPSVFPFYPRTIVATSHSKDLNLPGERIGYIAVSPHNTAIPELMEGLTLCNRILGFVNAPALFQRLAGVCQEIEPDMTVYTENRAILMEGLTTIGYELTAPGGGFYLFPRSPLPDEVAFIDLLRKQNILVVPGSGFGWPGAFRISFCCEPATCRRSLPGFAAAYEEARAGLL